MNEAPIISLISDKAKEKIKEQIAYLEEMSQKEEYKKEFTAYLDGAKTVLHILEDESIGKHGTSNFLKQLDRDQLQYAIEEGKRILKEKTSLGKVKLYGVFGGQLGSEWFDNSDCAKKNYLVAAQESLEDSYPEVKLIKRMVPLEEAEEYLGEEKYAEFVKKQSNS